MTKQVQHQVSLKRPDGFYTADNELIDVFAPLIGIYALGVYHLLKQRAFKNEKDRAISLLGISKALAISKESAGAAIATLRQIGLVEMHSSLSANKPPRYEVVHAKDVLAAHPEYRTQGNSQFPQEPAKSRTRVMTHSARKVGHVAGEIQDADSRYLGRQTAKSRTPNKEEESKEERKEQDIPPTLPPEGGGNQVVALDGLTPVRDTLVGLLSHLKSDDPRREIQRAEDAINPTPRQSARFFLDYLHDMFMSTPSAPGFAAVRGDNWEDPREAWMRCFDHVRVGDVEADGNQMVVLLETPKPKDLVAGLTKYRAKVQLAMKKAFGREVQLVPRLEAA